MNLKTPNLVVATLFVRILVAFANTFAHLHASQQESGGVLPLGFRRPLFPE